MKKYVITSLPICLLLISQGCKKDSPAPEPTVAELLIGKWYVTERIYEGENQMLSDCQKKSFFEFKTDNSFKLDNYGTNAGDECVVSSADGTYSVDQEDMQLTLHPSGEDPGVVDILSITAAELKLATVGIAERIVLQKR